MVFNFLSGFGRATSSAIVMVIASLLSAFTAVAPVEADDDRYDVQRAIDSGEVVPLQRLFTRIRRDFDGQVLKIELERENYGGDIKWIYEAKILTPKGHVLKLEFDAQALELIDIEGRYEYDE